MFFSSLRKRERNRTDVASLCVVQSFRRNVVVFTLRAPAHTGFTACATV